MPKITKLIPVFSIFASIVLLCQAAFGETLRSSPSATSHVQNKTRLMRGCSKFHAKPHVGYGFHAGVSDCGAWDKGLKAGATPMSKGNDL
jgi:hypothetical protein